MIISIIVIPSFGFNYVLEYKIDEKIIYVKNKIIEFSNFSSSKSSGQPTVSFKTKQKSTFRKYENEFNTKPKEQNLAQTNINTDSKSDKNIENTNTVETFSTFLFLNLLHLVVLFIFFKITNKMYSNKRDKNLTDVDSELKSELEIKMSMLRDK